MGRSGLDGSGLILMYLFTHKLNPIAILVLVLVLVLRGRCDG